MCISFPMYIYTTYMTYTERGRQKKREMRACMPLCFAYYTVCKWIMSGTVHSKYMYYVDPLYIHIYTHIYILGTRMNM